MSKPKTELTAETITTIINDKRPTSLTQISKALGHKGTISGAVAARIRELVPTISELLAANKDAKGGGAGGATPKVAKPAKPAASKKTADKPQVPPTQNEGERLCPFRMGSKYSAIWLSLWRHRKNGVTRKALVEEITADKKMSDPKTADFAVTVVASPTEDGRANRSADKAGDVYWVEKSDGGNLKLHLRNRKA